MNIYCKVIENVEMFCLDVNGWFIVLLGVIFVLGFIFLASIFNW